MSTDGIFHIGDKVVYPNHGVGIIEQISSRTIGETVEKFYLLKIEASSLKVMVPFHNVTTVGLRRVVAMERSRRSWTTSPRASAVTRPIGRTGTRKIRSACAPVLFWTWPRC